MIQFNYENFSTSGTNTTSLLLCGYIRRNRQFSKCPRALSCVSSIESPYDAVISKFVHEVDSCSNNISISVCSLPGAFIEITQFNLSIITSPLRSIGPPLQAIVHLPIPEAMLHWKSYTLTNMAVKSNLRWPATTPSNYQLPALAPVINRENTHLWNTYTHLHVLKREKDDSHEELYKEKDPSQSALTLTNMWTHWHVQCRNADVVDTPCQPIRPIHTPKDSCVTCFFDVYQYTTCIAGFGTMLDVDINSSPVFKKNKTR